MPSIVRKLYRSLTHGAVGTLGASGTHRTSGAHRTLGTISSKYFFRMKMYQLFCW
jgi:hypothetical protein